MDRILYPLARVAIQILVMLLAPRLRISGQHHLSHRGPVILAPNHSSHADSALLCAAVRRPLWFMAMRDIFKNPFLARFATFFKAFPIERDSADRAGLSFAETLLAHKQVLVVYPEGRLSLDGNLGHIQSGAALLALRSGATLIPVGISHSTQLMPYGMQWPRLTLAPIRVHFGEPISMTDLAHLPKRQQRQIATQRLEEALRRATAIAQQ